MPNNSAKTLLILLAILMVAGAAVGYYLYLSSKEAKDSIASISLSATDTPFTDINGEVVDLTQYVNEIRVVNSWASWSPLSKDELPVLNEVAAKYNPQGVIFLAINRQETKEYAGGYLTSLPPLDNLKLVFDPVDSFFKNVEGYAMPETIVFDRVGNISAHYRGLLKREELEQLLDGLIAADN